MKHLVPALLFSAVALCFCCCSDDSSSANEYEFELVGSSSSGNTQADSTAVPQNTEAIYGKALQ